MVHVAQVVGTAVTLQTGSSYTVSCLAIYLVGVAAQDTSWTYALDILLIGDAVVLLALFFVFRWQTRYASTYGAREQSSRERGEDGDGEF